MSPSLIYSFALQLPAVLLHFLWQGAAIGIVAFLANAFLQERKVRLCYAINMTLLLSLLTCIPATFWALSDKNSVSIAADIEQSLAAIPNTHTNHLVAAEQPVKQQSVAEPESIEQMASVPARDRRNEDFRILVTIIYLVGVLVMLSRTARAAWQVHRLSSRESMLPPQSLLTSLSAKANQLGLATVPVIKVCKDVSIPVVVGLVRPMILMPVSTLCNLKHEEIETILVHELAHIRRYDLWANLVQRLVEALLFFHPAVWYISKQTSRCREVCCDEAVLSHGCNKLQYAAALINMASLAIKSGAQDRLSEQMSLAAGRVSNTDFNRRVCRLLGIKNKSYGFAREWMFVIATVVSVFALCVTITASQQVVAQEPQEYKTTSQKLDFLKKIVDAQRDNVSKIHTWKASYQYEFRFLREGEDTKKPYWDVKTGDLLFSVDFGKQLLRTYYNPVGGIMIEDESGKKIEESSISRGFGGSRASNVEYVVSEAEIIKYNHESYHQMPGERRGGGGVPHQGHAVELYKNQGVDNQMGGWFDPIKFFAFDGGGSKDFTYQRYESIAKHLSDLTPEKQAEQLKPMGVNFENGKWVMIIGGYKAVYDPTLKTCLEYRLGNDNELVYKFEAKYTTNSGVTIPSEFVETRYIQGKENNRSTYKLVTSEMNPSFSADEFTLDGLKLPNGTRVTDSREKEFPIFGRPQSTDFSDAKKRREEAAKKYSETTKVLLDGTWLSIDEYNAKVPD